jgi:hypothetical protein
MIFSCLFTFICSFNLHKKEIFKPLEDNTESSIKKTEVESDKDYINNTITIGTGLFELYLALQTIVR